MNAETKWWCTIGGQQYGPVSQAEFVHWIHQNRVTDRDLVWNETMTEWLPLGQVRDTLIGQADPAQPPIPPFASAPGGAYAPYRAYPEQSRGVLILVLGVLGFVIGGAGLIAGPIAWSMANTDLPKIDAGLMPPGERSMVEAGKICGIITFCLSLVGCLFFCLWLGLFGAFAH